MAEKFDKILDECIDRINRGEDIESCLISYPEYRQELRPILSAMLRAKDAYSFTPSALAKDFHRQRLTAAMVASRESRAMRKPLFTQVLAWPKVWATAAAVIVIGLVCYFGLRPVLMPPVMIAQPNPAGNFVFLISDEVNDIGDFKELNLSISRVSLRLSGDEEKIIELFESEVQRVNLVNLQDNRAQEIWRGDIPEGGYTKVFLEVSSVSGTLWDGGREASIKLPSGKLQISKPFTVISTEVTSFVYDLTVVKAGKSGQYILKPQIDQSGADQDFIKVEAEGRPEADEKLKGKSQELVKPAEQSIEFEGVITALSIGANNSSPWTMILESVNGDVTVYVAKLEGTPSVMARARVEGVLKDDTIRGAKAKIIAE